MREKLFPQIKDALSQLWNGPINLQPEEAQRPVSQSEALKRTMDQLGRATVLQAMGVSLSGDSAHLFELEPKRSDAIKRPLRIVDSLPDRIVP